MQLALNSDRVRAARIVDAAYSIDVAALRRTVPPEWIEWLTDSPRDAAKWLHEQNVSLLRR